MDPKGRAPRIPIFDSPPSPNRLPPQLVQRPIVFSGSHTLSHPTHPCRIIDFDTDLWLYFLALSTLITFSVKGFFFSESVFQVCHHVDLSVVCSTSRYCNLFDTIPRTKTLGTTTTHDKKKVCVQYVYNRCSQKKIKVNRKCMSRSSTQIRSASVYPSLSLLLFVSLPSFGRGLRRGNRSITSRSCLRWDHVPKKRKRETQVPSVYFLKKIR